jgi:hypothetical protein
MSEQSREPESSDAGVSVGDDELPEDLQPREDNPLAQPAGDDVPDDILEETAGGRSDDRSGDTSGDDPEDPDADPADPEG